MRHDNGLPELIYSILQFVFCGAILYWGSNIIAFALIPIISHFDNFMAFFFFGPTILVFSAFFYDEAEAIKISRYASHGFFALLIIFVITSVLLEGKEAMVSVREPSGWQVAKMLSAGIFFAIVRRFLIFRYKKNGGQL